MRSQEDVISDSQIMLDNGQNLYDYLRAQGLSSRGTKARLGNGIARPLAITPEDQRIRIIALMVAKVRDYACTRGLSGECRPPDKWNYSPDPTNPELRPRQTGLAYVYGRRTPDVRVPPTGACAGTYELHGTDCSGLVYLASTPAGLLPPPNVGVAGQRDETKWAPPLEPNLEMKEVTNGTFKQGDVVAWRGHIGIAQNGGSDPSIISSTGSNSAGACESNRQPPRGPRALKLSQLERSTLGRHTKVIRLSTPDVFTVAINPSATWKAPGAASTTTSGKSPKSR